VKAYQFITFGPIPTKKIGDPDFSPGAAASSGLQVSYTSSNTNVGVIAGNLIHIAGVGNASITSSQAGNGNYYAATSVLQVLTVDNVVPVKINNFSKNTYQIVVVPNPVKISSDGTTLFLICEKPVYAVKITIFDCLGNTVYTVTKHICHPDSADRISLTKWDLTGKLKRKVDAGSYRAAVQFTDSQGIRRSVKAFIGVKR
jgi:hypothetical protein